MAGVSDPEADRNTDRVTAEIHAEQNSRWWTARFAVGVVATGVLAGAGGIVLTLLLHLVQHLAYGYSEDSFLFGAERAAPSRRLLAMAAGGLLIGAGWWALRRWTTPVPTVADVIKDPRRGFRLPEATTDAALQIVGVGIGGSLGREGAPRLLGAALADRLSAALRLTAGQRRTVVACGAGAGLAAVYNVPLGGALFTLEIVLGSALVTDVVPALISAAIATAVSWPVLSTRPTYAVAVQGAHPQVLVWAVLLGPVAGLVSVGFIALVARARSGAPTGWKLVLGCFAAFTAVGAASMAYPELLGNGKGPTQLALDGTLSVLLLAVLVIGKPLATAGCLAGGAIGGLLTPALATGAVLGALTGIGWSQLWPGAPVTSYAIVGAAAVLATTQRAPLCAIVLVLEFTHCGFDLTVPLLLAVAGSMLTARALNRRQ